MKHNEVPPIDFDRAYLSWITKSGIHGRWRLIASASLIREGSVDRFVLAPMVMAGNLFSSGRLPKDPPYSYQLLASSKQHAIFRDLGPGGAPSDTASLNNDVFSSLTIEAPLLRATRIDPHSLALDELRKLWPLAVRVRLGRGQDVTWILDFPLSHISTQTMDGINAFQIETGPVLIPADLIQAPAVSRVGGFALAYVFLNRLDRLDLALFGATGAAARSARRYAHYARLDALSVDVFGSAF